MQPQKEAGGEMLGLIFLCEKAQQEKSSGREESLALSLILWTSPQLKLFSPDPKNLPFKDLHQSFSQYMHTDLHYLE